MKTIIPLLVWASFIQISSAQYIPITRPMSTPGGNIPMTTYMWIPRNNYSGRNLENSKRDYIINLKEDSIITRYCRIDMEDHMHSITFKVNKEKKTIYPKDTKEVVYISESGEKYTGMPTDSCWLFKTGSGRINTYAYLPEKDPAYIVAIQKGNDGTIVPLTKKNLKSFIENDPEAIKWVEKNKPQKAIREYNSKK